MEKALLGIDIGTSSIKCCLFDLKGRTLYTSSSGYRTIKGKPGELEIDPEDIFDSLIRNIRGLVRDNSSKYSIEAAGICAVMIMPVFLTKDNKIARPIIHWFDNRPHTQYQRLKDKKKHKTIARLSGSSLTAEGTINSILWVKENEPAIYEKIERSFQLKDYARFRLTGNILTDHGDASGTQLYDTKEWKWNDVLIGELGIKRSMFCKTHRPTDVGGYITEEISSLTGLAQGTPVAVGSGDGITTIFGLGIYKEGHTGITVGSAGVIATPSKKYPRDEAMRNYIFCHPFGDRWFSLMATASTGEVFRWYIQNIIKDDSATLPALEEESSNMSEPGARGITFLPYILGARNPVSDPKAYGVLLGLRHYHHRADVTRAVLEGLSLELLDIIKAQADIFSKLSKDIGKYRLSGGILKGSLWKQILADILGQDLTLTDNQELGCLGSAVYASVSAGIYKDLEQALKNMVNKSGIITNSKQHKEIYDRKYSIFKNTYELFKDRFDEFVL